MAKTRISEYDSNAANNTDVDGVNIAESCPPSGINNAIREVMAHLKDFQSGVSGDTLPLASGGTNATNASDARTNLGLGAMATKASVATADIDADAIDGTKIADDAIANEHIAAGAVQEAQIDTSAVTSTKIADSSVSVAKIDATGTKSSSTFLRGDGQWAVSGALGVGQTWQNLTSSRALGTTYTNNTGKPIMVNVNCTGQPNHCRMRLKVDGVTVGEGGVTSVASAAMYPTVSAIVPNGSTYIAENVLGASLQNWAELR